MPMKIIPFRATPETRASLGVSLRAISVLLPAVALVTSCGNGSGTPAPLPTSQGSDPAFASASDLNGGTDRGGGGDRPGSGVDQGGGTAGAFGSSAPRESNSGSNASDSTQPTPTPSAGAPPCGSSTACPGGSTCLPVASSSSGIVGFCAPTCTLDDPSVSLAPSTCPSGSQCGRFLGTSAGPLCLYACSNASTCPPLTGLTARCSTLAVGSPAQWCTYRLVSTSSPAPSGFDAGT